MSKSEITAVVDAMKPIVADSEDIVAVINELGSLQWLIADVNLVLDNYDNWIGPRAKHWQKWCVSSPLDSLDT